MVVDTLLHWLVGRSWVDPARVVAGEVQVRVRDRRHTSFTVHVAGGSGGVFVKQLRRPHPETVAGLAREARFCAAVEGPLRAIVPRRIGWDPRQHLLVLERVDGVALVDGPEDVPFTPMVAEALGHALRAVHEVGPGAARRWGAADDLPWPFGLPRFLVDRPHEAEGAGAALAPVIARTPGLVAHIEAQARVWRRTALIHADLKGENVLVRPDGGVALVDWESALVGDPAWDVAYVLQAGVARGLLRRGGAHPVGPSIPGVGSRRAFWKAWSAGRPDRAELARRVTGYAGVRFVHAAYEHAATQATLRPSFVAMVATAADVFRDPDAAARWLGVSS